MAILQKTLNLDFQSGKKTYILAIVFAIYTALSYFYGDLSASEAITRLFGDGVVVTLRKAIS